MQLDQFFPPMQAGTAIEDGVHELLAAHGDDEGRKLVRDILQDFWDVFWR